MADKKFGVKQINLIGASGTPTLTSPNNLNINAANVAISTDISVGGRIVGTSTSNVIPFLYNTYSDLPSASTYHGAFAHVHESGKALYAHSSSWFEIVNKESNGTVGTGTEVYSVGSLAIPGGTGTSNRIELGDSREFTFQYNTSNSAAIISSGGNPTDIKGTAIRLKSNADENMLIASNNGAVSIYHDNSNKFETTGAGVTVTGTTFTNQLNVSGVSTSTLIDAGTITLTNTGTSIDIPASGEIRRNSVSWISADSDTTITMGSPGSASGDFIVKSYFPSISGTTEIFRAGYGNGGNGAVTLPNGTVSAGGSITGSELYGDVSLAVSGKWTLGANGSSDYTFTGTGIVGTENDPVIYLARGAVYEFVNNSGGSHPFQIRQSNGGSAYNTGVTNNGASSGTIRFEVPFSAPNTLYYQCTSHSGMGNNIVVYPTV